jgi:hypothetical protein
VVALVVLVFLMEGGGGGGTQRRHAPLTAGSPRGGWCGGAPCAPS